MFSSHAVARDFSRAAHAYEQEASLQRRTLSQLANVIPKEALVLDAGCATGALATLIPNAIIGVDIAETMCAVASTRMPAAVASVEALPLKDAAVDAVVSSFVLQWVNQPAQALTEFRRVLKPEGRAFINLFGEQTLCELRAACDAAGLQHRVNDFAPLAVWEQRAATAGFTVVKSTRRLEQEAFPTVRALMQHLKTIGALSKREDRPKHLLTPRQLTAIEKHYPQSESGITASFEVVGLELLLR
jgi:malonyl-CoA O-methyltransferase